MDWWMWLLTFVAVFGFGFWVGVAVLFKIWLEPSLDKGILDFGSVTYKISRIVKRNTRI